MYKATLRCADGLLLDNAKMISPFLINMASSNTGFGDGGWGPKYVDTPRDGHAENLLPGPKQLWFDGAKAFIESQNLISKRKINVIQKTR